MSCNEAFRSQAEVEAGKQMKVKEKYFCSPPEKEIEFSDLFRHIWDTGIGKVLDENGLPHPWTAPAFEDAFGLANVKISQRAVEYWRAGETVPSVKNMRALAVLISEQDAFTEWLLAIQASVKLQKANSKTPTLENGSTDDDVSAQVNVSGTQTWRFYRPTPLYTIAAAFVASAVLFFAYRTLFPARPKVVDLMICGPDAFSQTDLVCTNDEARFPAGTKKIYISFDFKHMKPGQEFQRKWFIDGRLYLEKSSNYVEPWDGWTWLGNLDERDPAALDMEPGQYTLQIHVGNSIEVKSFNIEP